jgi:hypothetical protein
MLTPTYAPKTKEAWALFIYREENLIGYNDRRSARAIYTEKRTRGEECRGKEIARECQFMFPQMAEVVDE